LKFGGEIFAGKASDNVGDTNISADKKETVRICRQ